MKTFSIVSVLLVIGCSDPDYTKLTEVEHYNSEINIYTEGDRSEVYSSTSIATRDIDVNDISDRVDQLVKERINKHFAEILAKLHHAGSVRKARSKDIDEYGSWMWAWHSAERYLANNPNKQYLGATFDVAFYIYFNN